MVPLQRLQNYASRGEIADHDFPECIEWVDGFIENQRHGGGGREHTDEMPDYRIRRIGRKVRKTALRDKERRKRRIEMSQFPLSLSPDRTPTTPAPHPLPVQRPQIHGMDMIVRGMEFRVSSEVEQGVADVLTESGGVVDSGDLRGGVDREVEFVIEDVWGFGLRGEAEEAGVGAGAEGDDLVARGGGGVEEFFDEEVNGAGADVGAWLGYQVSNFRKRFVLMSEEAEKRSVVIGTSIYDRESALRTRRCEFLCKRIIQIPHRHGAHPRDIGIGIRPLDNLILPRRRGLGILLSILPTPSHTAETTSPNSTGSMCARGEEVGNLRSVSHGGVGRLLLELWGGPF